VKIYFDSSVVLRVVLGAVLERAAEPFPTQMRTLDALHVASALLVRTRFPALRFATHDADLAAAALAEGLPVLGA
jgi:predicted nucleic acid-binding protein